MPRRINTGSSTASSPRHAQQGSDASSVTSDSAYSTVSYRQFLTSPSTPTQPQPVLSRDAAHRPKTNGSVGILIVGVGGANGTTLLAGVHAHRMQLSWHGPTGEPRSCSYGGCITQLDVKGGGVGYRNRVKGLADATLAAVGGWVCSARCAEDLVLTFCRIFDPPDQEMLSCKPKSSIMI